jgi:endogenous inhibitor of DNA gyrase (YacG/DUF329 family)
MLNHNDTYVCPICGKAIKYGDDAWGSAIYPEKVFCSKICFHVYATKIHSQGGEFVG